MTSCGGMKRVMKTLSFCLEDVCTKLGHKHWCANMMQGNFLLTNEHIRNQFVAPCGRGKLIFAGTAVLTMQHVLTVT